jgi:Flp pilus assembly protein TadG
MKVRHSVIDAREHTTAARRLLAARIRHFGRDEGGTIIVMTIIFLSLMLIMGGMAVDFMRFESRRTMLQSVADRSVLAAANLGNSKDPKEVVVDYFTKAGFPDSIVGEPDVKTGNKFNSVGVTAAYDMNSIFLRLVGIDMLSAPAAATAIEGVSNIEVSLVVDISGSMRDPVVPADGSYSNQTKIEALRGAATKFVDAMLIPDYKDRISISLVPYS